MGGVEGSDTHEETAVKECLEEVGIKIKHVESLGLNKVFPPLFNKTERNAQYSGVDKYFYVGIYDCIDKSLLGADGDDLPYSWVSLDEAFDKVKDNGEHGAFRAEAIQALSKKFHISMHRNSEVGLVPLMTQW